MTLLILSFLPKKYGFNLMENDNLFKLHPMDECGKNDDEHFNLIKI
jgi:hypothetical protein